MSVSRELLAQLEQDADNLFKRFNKYLPSGGTACQETAPARQPLQHLSNHQNSSSGPLPTTSGRQMAENIVTSLKQELAADGANQSEVVAQEPPAVPRHKGRRKPSLHPSSSHSAPATASSRLNISQGSSAIIAQALTSFRRADNKPTVFVEAACLTPPRPPAADQEALAVACAAAALGTEHRVKFLADTLRGHTHEQARLEALRLLKKMGTAAIGAAAAVQAMLELYPGYDSEFVALCAEALASIGTSATEPASGILMRIARDRSFSKQPDCGVHAAAANALAHCSLPTIIRLAELATEVGGEHGVRLLEGLLNTAPMLRAAVVPLLLREASHADGARRETAMAALSLVRSGLLELVPALIELLVGGHVCRDTCCTVLRAQGTEGEQVLLALALRNPIERVRLACTSALGRRAGVAHKDSTVDPTAELLVQVSWVCPYASQEPPIELSPDGLLKLDGHQLCAALVAIHPSALDRSLSCCRRHLPEASASNEVCTTLRTLQRDPLASLRAAAVSAVAELVAAEQLDVRRGFISDTIGLLNDADAAVREQATYAVGYIGPQLAGAQLAGIVQVGAMLMVCAEGLLQVLPALLRDERPKVRRACCVALAQLGPMAAAAALPALSKALLDGSTNRDELACTIAALGSAGEEILMKQMNSSSRTPVRVACAQALGRSMHSLESPHVAADAIVHLACSDPSPNARRAMVRLLGELGSSPARIPQLQPRRLWPLLYSLLSDKTAGLGATAAQALAESGAEELLIAAVQRDECCKIRAAACAGLLELHCGAVLHALLMTLNDREPKVRCAASEALLSIGAQQATNTMADVLEEEQQGGHTQKAQMVWCTLQEMLQSPYPQTAPLKAFLVSLEKSLESYELDMV